MNSYQQQQNLTRTGRLGVQRQRLLTTNNRIHLTTSVSTIPIPPNPRTRQTSPQHPHSTHAFPHHEPNDPNGHPPSLTSNMVQRQHGYTTPKKPAHLKPHHSTQPSGTLITPPLSQTLVKPQKATEPHMAKKCWHFPLPHRTKAKKKKEEKAHASFFPFEKSRFLHVICGNESLETRERASEGLVLGGLSGVLDLIYRCGCLQMLAWIGMMGGM